MDRSARGERSMADVGVCGGLFLLWIGTTSLVYWVHHVVWVRFFLPDGEYEWLHSSFSIWDAQVSALMAPALLILYALLPYREMVPCRTRLALEAWVALLGAPVLAGAVVFVSAWSGSYAVAAEQKIYARELFTLRELPVQGICAILFEEGHKSGDRLEIRFFSGEKVEARFASRPVATRLAKRLGVPLQEWDDPFSGLRAKHCVGVPRH